MLSRADMAGMRSTQEQALPDRMDVYRLTYSSDGFGGQNQGALTQVMDDVDCRATPAQVQMQGGQASRQLEMEKWTVRYSKEYGIEDEDILVITTLDNQQLQVETVKAPKSWETVRTAMCEHIRGNTFQVPS